MAKKEVDSDDKVYGEKSILPLKYVDLMEDIFHAVLAIALLGIGIGAFFFSIKRLIETAPFFPNGMMGTATRIRKVPKKISRSTLSLPSVRD